MSNHQSQSSSSTQRMNMDTSNKQCNINAKRYESSSIIDKLDISPFLKSRIQQRLPGTQSHKDSTSSTCTSSITTSSTSSSEFILYLPTVNLRMDQNPAFALACHIANYYQIPLVILAVLLDDKSMPSHLSPSSSSSSQKSTNHPASPPHKEITMTARRLAFLTEALSESCTKWSNHGAGVTIRIHKPHSRTPDHLTLSSRSKVVITDEPFVHPFLSYVHKIEHVCYINSKPCFRVDGSTTVPPCSILTKVKIPNTNHAGRPTTTTANNVMDVDINRNVYYTGVPSKAWMWQKRTESYRMGQLQAAMDGHFDAPPVLINRIDNDTFFLEQDQEEENDDSSSKNEKEKKMKSDNDNISSTTNIQNIISPTTFPLHWRKASNEAPGTRPWSVSELQNISNSSTSIKEWAINWPGSDSSVKPCTQTIGTYKAGMQRWNNWITERKGLLYYAKKRTDPLQPHGSSRMSCYLNFGIVSIFRLVYEVKVAQMKRTTGADKFEEEIVKWREMSYAHSFARGDYNCRDVVPQWAQRWLVVEKYKSILPSLSSSSSLHEKVYDLDCLENCDSGDDIWDAMQGYLVSTGELHNNVRMTWGKMLVHWIHCSNSNNLHSLGDSGGGGGNDPISNLLHVLCYLNDRFALDGLSPPSYAGLLWCIGWSDKPNSKGEISTKRRYKYSASRFRDAERILRNDTVELGVSSSSRTSGSSSHGEQTTIFQSFRSATVTSKRSYTGLGGDHNSSLQDENETSTVKKMKRSENKKTLHDFFIH